jgi:hypothetical protein
MEAKVMHEISDLEWDDDRLIRCNAAQRLAIQMIEVGMSDQDEVDRGKFVQMQAGMPYAFDYFEPFGPVRIDEKTSPIDLNQEGCVADPGDANFVWLELGKNGRVAGSSALRKERGNEDFREKVPSMPSSSRF